MKSADCDNAVPTEAAKASWCGASRNDLGELAEYTEAIRHSPGDPTLFRSRARVHLRAEEPDDAIADFSEAMRLDPGHYSDLIERGSILLSIGEYEAALDDYADALRLAPDESDVHSRLGLACWHVDEFEHAIDHVTEAIRREPRRGEFFRQRGDYRRAHDEVEAALADYDEALCLDPTDAKAFLQRGSLRLQLERLPGALADLSEAIRLAPSATAYKQRAACWDQQGDEHQADADRAAALELTTPSDSMTGSRSQIFPLIKAHFAPVALDAISITQREFPNRVRADLQQAMEVLLARWRVHHFSGARQSYAFQRPDLAEMLVRVTNDPPIVSPPQFDEVDIGEEQPVRCLMVGLWFLEDEAGTRFVVLLRPPAAHGGSAEIGFQIAAPNDESGARLTQSFFKHLEDEVRRARSYRGKVLSLEWSDGYDGTATGIRVHRLRPTERDHVILPQRTLELLERNVIGFVRRRHRLAEAGMATKKGLLFYGPPGTGKTHTIHYLAGALEDTTTLLIAAEEVGRLGEYMTLARLLQPSLVVIEDADLIARDRTSMSSACEEVLLNKLLNEMDGLKGDAAVLFVLTTNRPEALEAALASRPGRIDQAIEFPFPDAEGRAKLVRLYAGRVPLSDPVVDFVVQRTEGVSAAFIKELMRRAAQFRLERDDTMAITTGDVESALEELLFRGGSLNRKLLGGGMDSPD